MKDILCLLFVVSKTKSTSAKPFVWKTSESIILVKTNLTEF